MANFIRVELIVMTINIMLHYFQLKNYHEQRQDGSF